MKRKLKKLNRGLVLAGIVLILLMIYMIVDHITFLGDKEELQDVVTGYITDITTLLPAPEGYEELDPDAALSAVSQVLDQYFSYDSGSYPYASSCTDIYNSFDSFYREAAGKTEFIIFSYETSVSDLTIKKNGPGGALVSLTIAQRLEFGYEGDKALSICFPEPFYYYTNLYDVVDPPAQSESLHSGSDALHSDTDAEQEVSQTVEHQIVFELAKKNGSWKILNVDERSDGLVGLF